MTVRILEVIFMLLLIMGVFSLSEAAAVLLIDKTSRGFSPRVSEEKTT